jgi:hypothetical protein
MKRIIVEFKETYMDKSVIRECEVSSLDEVIRLYELNNSDIEHWKVLKETDI